MECFVNRHLYTLQCLWTKLSLRYGERDALVQDVRREIDRLEVASPKTMGWPRTGSVVRARPSVSHVGALSR